ncbi:hypothetical protein Nepgr_016468 [Nepenthes gracilis]|uniref:Uncharacterized protein n=1 Tax=Nepenthes gracilis TaxID=150966 RepID=A0AAD3SQH8_NEPGR|nr:hypothetical protein Nepgr_016468 [Nepenthes gracilis]
MAWNPSTIRIAAQHKPSSHHSTNQQEETPNSGEWIPSVELPIAGSKRDVNSVVGYIQRFEHVLPSYSELYRLMDNEACLHVDGHIKTSYADTLKRGVEIDEPIKLEIRVVQGEDTLKFSSSSDEVSEVSQDRKLKYLSPLARRVAARIYSLHHAVDKSERKDEALHGLASSLFDYLNPRSLDSSLKICCCFSPVWSLGRFGLLMWPLLLLSALLMWHVAAALHLKVGWSSLAVLDYPAIVALTRLAAVLAGLDFRQDWPLKTPLLLTWPLLPIWNAILFAQSGMFAEYARVWALAGLLSFGYCPVWS